MRAWTTLTVDETCGYCGGLIPVSTPALVLEGPGLRRRVRCPADAREPVGHSGWLDASVPATTRPDPADANPWDLTRHRRDVARVSPRRAPVPLATIAAALPFDARMAAAGKDD